MEIRKFAVLRCTWQTKAPNAPANWPIWSDADLTTLFNGSAVWSIASYWQASTLGLLRPQFDIVGSVVLKGTQGAARGNIVALARQAATDAKISLAGYAGLLAFVHPPPNDAGGFLGSTDAALDGNGFIEFYDHEVGHMLGFQHPWSPQGAYADDYCVMGFTNPQSHVLPPAAPFATISPLHAQFWQEGRRVSAASLYRYLPAFAQSNSVMHMPAAAQGDVPLTAVSEASLGDPILLVCDDPGGEFTVEYRTNTRQDVGVTPAIVVHSFGRNALPTSAKEVRPVWFEVAIRAPYTQRWLASNANLCIEVIGKSSDGRQVTVRASRPFPIAASAHSGNLIQSDYGLGNYECLICRGGGRLAHLWRDTGDRTFPWHAGHTYNFHSTVSSTGNAIAVTDPVGVSLIRSSIKGDGQRSNFDAIVRMHPRMDPTHRGDVLSFCGFDTKKRQWSPLAHIIADGQLVDGVTGDAALVQSNFGTVGNYEMLVPAGPELRHYWRNNDSVSYDWHRGHTYRFGGTGNSPGSTAQAISEPVGVAMLVSSIKGDGIHGNFDVIVRMRPRLNPGGNGDRLYFCAFDTNNSQWTAPRPLSADGHAIDGVSGKFAFMQSSFGTTGNYELLVPIGFELRHYWRNNDDPQFAWHAGHVYKFNPTGQAGATNAVVAMEPLGVTMLQSSIRGDGVHGNFDALVRVRPKLDPQGLGDRLYFCAFDTATGQWNPLREILVDGSALGDITGF